MAEQENEYGVTPAEDTQTSNVVTIDENREQGQPPRNPSGQAVGLAEESPLNETQNAEALEAMKAERDQLLDRLTRLQAEFDNARKRQEREKLEFRDYATGSVIEQFFPVMDNFSLALGSNASAEQLRTGVELILKQMDEILRGLQVQVIPTVGEVFDPRVHEALGSVERDDLPDHTIAEEIRKGYRIRERLLRPALVRIVSNPHQTEA
jgi:molecular chaperone GrpE